MDKLTSILVIADRTPADHILLAKAVELARAFGATIELYTCDSEHAADLRRAYDTAGVEKEWLERVWEGRDYLEALRKSVPAPDVQVFVDSMCDVRTYEAIAKKIAACHPDLVMKSATTARAGRFALDAADWELMRICAVDLLLIRGRQWQDKPRFAAMVNMLDPETPSVPKEVMHAAEYLALGCDADLDVVYCERDEGGADRAARAAELQDLAREHKVGSERVHVLSGDPDEVLPAFASRNDYDVVVLGALTHRKRLADLVGRLTGRVADALDSDLLLVKSSAPARAAEASKAGVLWQGVFGD
jgi:universal stress protein E